MTIYGSDVSHYDDPDTRSMFSAGIMFQTHKAGGDVNDAELGTWWGLARNYRDKALLGAYWVLYPGNPVADANEFVARLDQQCSGWRDGPFILQADCEIWSGQSNTLPPISQVNAFCDRLVQLCPKLRPIVYAPKWCYGDKVSALKYPLWASQYVTGTAGFKGLYPGDSSSKWAAYGGKTPAILQYSSSATIGDQTTCDANAFRGTLAQLTALLAPGWTENIVALDATDAKTLLTTDGIITTPSNASDKTTNSYRSAADSLQNIEYHVRATEAAVSALAAQMDLSIDPDDIAAIVAGVLAGLSPEAIAAAIPDDLAVQVADELAKRLAA